MERIITEVHTVAAGTVRQCLDERLGISQSTVPVLEEPSGVTIALDELDLTGIGRGVDQSGQEDDGNGESATENHCAER